MNAVIGSLEQQEESPSLHDYLAMLRRRRWQLIIPALILFLIAAVAAVAIPASYRSSATILIEQQEIPQDLVRSTVTSYADQRVQVISQRVMNTANLSSIIDKYDLYLEERKRSTLATVVEDMRQDVQLQMVSADVVDPRSGRPTAATIAFTLAYDSKNPATAQKVANEIVSLFLNENVKKRREVAQEASEFLAEETGKLAAQISDLEAKLEVFKGEHGEALPEMKNLYMQLLQRIEDQLRGNLQDARSLEERIVYLELELAQMDPTSKLYSSTGERVLSPSDRLKTLESEYVTVASRYGETHPDRVRIEREIEALRRETGSGGVAELQRQLSDLKSELITLEERYSSQHPDVKRQKRAVAAAEKQLVAARKAGKSRVAPAVDADNPAYIQLESQLQAARSELRSLQVSKAELEAKISDYEERLTKAPKIEREYLTLTRDYENAMSKYREVKNKQQEAELAESLEVESKAERFVLIEPPTLPEKPHSPNRIAILFLGLVLSVAGGFGNVMLREQVDQRIRGVKDLLAVVGTPPLAVIPFLRTDEDIRRKRLRTIIGVISMVLIVVALVLAVHFLYRPLDILYFQLLQRFGLLS